MARVHDIGFETNSQGSDVEASSIAWTNGGGFTIQTGTVRTGTYALKVIPSAGGDVFEVTNSSSHIQFIRAYINISARPTGSNNSFIACIDANNGIAIALLAINTDGSLALFYSDTGGGFTQIGSNSSVIPLNTWTMVEMKVDDTLGLGSVVIEGRLGGSVFATGTESVITTGNGGVANGFWMVGDQIVAANTTGTWYLDDISTNDGSGSAQNSYPGIGALTRILPDAAGDSNGWSVNVGGTVGTANNFTRVNEVTPDDASSYNGSATLNQSDLYNMQDPSIGTDTVNCVHVLARMSQSTNNTTIQVQLQAEKAASGTKATNTAFNPNDTGWFLTKPGHDLVMYTDPDGGAWTESTLATMQVGQKLTTASGTVQIRVSDIWAYIDHAPAVVTATAATLPMMGIGS